MSLVQIISMNVNSLLTSHLLSQNRCLYEHGKWYTELIHCYQGVEFTFPTNIENKYLTKDYIITKSYYDLKEYDRAYFYASQCPTNPLISFIKYYSKYQSLNYKSNPSFQNCFNDENFDHKEAYKTLINSIIDYSNSQTLDVYHLYLLGLCMLKAGMREEATEIFLKCLAEDPMVWGAWLELVNLLPSYDKILEMDLPKHWISYFFMAKVLVRDMKYVEALTIYKLLQESIGPESSFDLTNCIYVKTEMANIHFQMKDMNQALSSFKAILRDDPYSLDYVDVFSNILFVLEKDEELSDLAHRCQEIDPFRPETCCVIGNYYSLKGDHEKAIIHFQRAITLNPQHYFAWILIGHEYNELKDPTLALYAYNKASEINPNDYRVWNGFGFTYEILLMPTYSLYYYKKAYDLNPTDSRLMMALGQNYETLGKFKQAKIYYSKAFLSGDLEENAVFKLARACEVVDQKTAVLAYTKYLQDAQNQPVTNTVQEAFALRYLGYYYFSTEDYPRALYYFQKCLGYVDTIEDGKIMVSKIDEIMTSKDDSE